MRAGSLCAGIGGADLALEALGPARDALGTIAAVAFAALVAVWPTVDRWTAGGAS